MNPFASGESYVATSLVSLRIIRFVENSYLILLKIHRENVLRH